jgi:hypothetical protein
MAILATQYDVVKATWSPSGGVSNGAQAVITAPDATTITVKATNAATVGNQWSIYFAVTQVGSYGIAWTAVGGGSLNDSVTVSTFTAPSLLTIQECYLSLNMSAGMIGSANDADMLIYAQAALGVVEGVVGPLTPRAVSQTFDGGSSSVILKWAAGSILNVIENGQTIYDWVPDLSAGIIRAGTSWWNRPFWPGIQNVEVQYMAGQGAVAVNARLAVREEFRFLWQQGRQGKHSGLDQQIISTSAVPEGFAIPNRVYELLQRVDQRPGFA